MRSFFLWCALFLSCRGGVPSVTPPSTGPTSSPTIENANHHNAPAPSSHLAGLTEEVLENGLTVYLYELKEVPLVSVRLVAPAGGAYETLEQNGLATVTKEMLISGAAGKSATELRESIELLGATLNADSYEDDAVLGLDGLSRDLNELLQMMADIALRPNFDPEEFLRVQDFSAIDAQDLLQDVNEVADNAARAAVFGEHPYGLPPQGTPSAIRSLTLEDVKKFYQARYTPRSSAIIVVGDFEASAALAEVKKLFASWKGEPATFVSEPKQAPPGRRLFIVNSGGDAADIRVAAPCINASHPDTPALDVVNDSLGGGFTSRLLDELRVNLGITYDVASVIETYRVGGWLSVETSTTVKNARIAVDAILKSMAEHRAIGPTQEDLKGAKAFFSVDTARLFEAPDTLAETLAQAFGNGAGPESLAKYQERLDAIDRPTAAEILEKHFPSGKDDVVIVVTGPAEKLKKQLAGLGDIQVLSVGERPH